MMCAGKIKPIICNVCKKNTIYDENISDAEMNKCENGHAFCDMHLMCAFNTNINETLIKVKEYLQRNYDNIENFNNFFNDNSISSIEDLYSKYEDIMDLYDVADKRDYHNCPICNLDAIKDDDAIKYLLKKYNITIKELRDEIKNQFNSYNEFKNFIK